MVQSSTEVSATLSNLVREMGYIVRDVKNATSSFNDLSRAGSYCGAEASPANNNHTSNHDAAEAQMAGPFTRSDQTNAAHPSPFMCVLPLC